MLLQVLSVQVPFIFKYIVDYLNDKQHLLEITTATGTVFTMITALVLGCKCQCYLWVNAL